jgi:hypothetical protein
MNVSLCTDVISFSSKQEDENKISNNRGIFRLHFMIIALSWAYKMKNSNRLTAKRY